jgi:hypothetical protein
MKFKFFGLYVLFYVVDYYLNKERENIFEKIIRFSVKELHFPFILPLVSHFYILFEIVPIIRLIHFIFWLLLK